MPRETWPRAGLGAVMCEYSRARLGAMTLRSAALAAILVPPHMAARGLSLPCPHMRRRSTRHAAGKHATRTHKSLRSTPSEDALSMRLRRKVC
eukprot:3125071-Prymnesium_polylepis.1